MLSIAPHGDSSDALDHKLQGYHTHIRVNRLGTDWIIEVSGIDPIEEYLSRDIGIDIIERVIRGKSRIVQQQVPDRYGIFTIAASLRYILDPFVVQPEKTLLVEHHSA